MIDDMADSDEESKQPTVNQKKTKNTKNIVQEIISDSSCDEDALESKIGQIKVDEEERFRHLEKHTELRVGGLNIAQSDEDEEETKVNSTGNKVPPPKKKNGPKMKNTTKDGLKQTKLSFSNNKNCKDLFSNICL